MLEFRCKKCKNVFSFEQHPFFQSLKGKLIADLKGMSDGDSLNAFSNAITEITREIRCQKCQSTVYLIGLGSFKIEKGIDATSEPFVQTIKGLVDLHKEYKSKTLTSESFLKYSDEVSEHAQAITDHLMWHPGTLVYFEDIELMNEAKNAIEELWDAVSQDELWDEMCAGGFSGLRSSIIWDYIERIRMIKPTFISVKPNTEVKTYFQEAMNAWSYGLNTAALILSCSILEVLLKQVLLKKDAKLVYDNGKGNGFKNIKEKDLEALINNAKVKRILNDAEARNADRIRRSRNAAVHKLKQFSGDETYKVIISTKELLETLLR